MATREQIIRSLRAADAAGDTVAATKLAAALRKMPPEQLAAESAPVTPPSSDVRSEFDNMPWYNKALTAVDDTIRIGSDGISMGYGDKLAALLYSAGGANYDEALAERRQKLEDAKTRAGTAGIAAEVGGAILNPVVSGMGKLASAAIPAGAGLTTRMGLRGVTGAAEGGVQGALSAGGHDQDIREGAKDGALFGAMAGPAGEMLASTGGKLLGAFDDVRPARSVDELEAVKNRAYADADAAGIKYSPLTTGSMVNNVRTDLRAANIDPDLHKRATALTNGAVAGRAGIPQTLTELDSLRKVVNRDIGDEPYENFMGDIIRRNIDDTIENTPQGGLLSGNASEAGPLIRNARGANRRYEASRAVNNAIDVGTRTVGKDGVEQIRAILNSPSKRRGFTPAEIDKMEKIVRPSAGRRVAGAVGKFGGAGGFGVGSTAAGISYGLGSIPMAAASMALPIVGATGRGVARGMDKKQLKELLELIDGSAGRTKNPLRRAVEGSGGLMSRAATTAHIQDRNSR